jgi:hypothetical protein
VSDDPQQKNTDALTRMMQHLSNRIDDNEEPKP